MFSEIEKTDGKCKLKLIKKEALTHDTYLYELEFPNKELTAGLWPSGHFVFH